MGSRLVLAGRTQPPLPIARLRARDRIAEIGPADLALTQAEAAALLRAAEATPGDDDVTVLHERTDGWPVGLYLAALYLRKGWPHRVLRALLHRGQSGSEASAESWPSSAPTR
ncbi:MAG: hypothetical protein JO037_16995 [Actinobacteria bacterium]|nr:hypothetical protein [Actinomycetota bacterium]